MSTNSVTTPDRTHTLSGYVSVSAEPKEEKSEVYGLTGRVTIQSTSQSPRLGSPGSSCSGEDWDGGLSPSPEKRATAGFYKELTGEVEAAPIDLFLEAYVTLADFETDVTTHEINGQYLKLDEDTQESIDAALIVLLSDEFPSLTDEEIELKIDEVIKNPFIKIKNPEDSRSQVNLLYQACINAKLHDAKMVADRVARPNRRRRIELDKSVPKVLFYDLKD